MELLHCMILMVILLFLMWIRPTWLTIIFSLFSLLTIIHFLTSLLVCHPNSPGICDVTISPIIVHRIIRKLKINSAAGPDGIPPIFFKNTDRTLNSPLTLLFRSFIDLHSLPQEWKLSTVTPILKKGNPADPSNYRPIALTCTCCKILESIIANELTNFLIDHKLISKAQHGFLKKHSTVTNLLESVNDWTLSLSNHNPVAIVYIDFQRAFDSVSHVKLVHKLSGYGIHGNL